MRLNTRPARPEDLETIARFVRALASYERLEQTVVSTPEAFGAVLFGDNPRRRQPAQIVMVGQRQQLDGIPRRALHHFGGRKQTIGGPGMRMKIGDEHGGWNFLKKSNGR